MYKEFYLMEREPFASIPIPDLFYDSQMHKSAWQYLVLGLRKNEPILLVTGEYGTGKTLLCLRLLKLMKKNKISPIVFVSNPAYNFSAILKKILDQLEIPVPSSSEEMSLLQTLYDYFENADTPKFVYLLLDDIHECNYSLLNNLKMLSSFNAFGHFPIKIILFGHTRFLKILDHNKFAPFKQRIKRIFSLRSLDFHEIKEYIYFRLIYSGADGKPVFDDSSIRRIQKLSRGIPRLINNWCDNCLWEAGTERLISIDEEHVRKVEKKVNVGSGIEAVGPVPEPVPVSRMDILKTTTETGSGEQYDKQTMKRQFQTKRDLTFGNDPPVLPRKTKKQTNLKKSGLLEGKNAIILALVLFCFLLLFLFFIQAKTPILQKETAFFYPIDTPSLVVVKSVPSMKNDPVAGEKGSSDQNPAGNEDIPDGDSKRYTFDDRFSPVISMLERNR